MKMWMISARLLCMRHLSGEHNEIHKHRHNFEKRHSIAGRIAINACEPMSMKSRHDELAAELRRRAVEAGRKPPHSPYEIPDLSYLPEAHRTFRVNREASLRLLVSRCPECARRVAEFGRIAA